jgi:hypothetical protein
MIKIKFLLVALSMTSITMGQVVNFSGDWKLNSSKSKLNEQFTMAPKEIILIQNGNDMNSERHASFQDQEVTINDKYSLDGKECINSGWQDTQKKSTAVWSDDKKSLKIITKFPLNDGEMTITEVYRMDGDNMIIESKSSSSFGDVSETMIYDKK